MAWSFSGKQDVYIEITEKYEQYILKGIYKSGDKLPSVRSAAQEMGVNPNTVARAYALLEEKGLICSLPKKGVYVKYEDTSLRTDSKMVLCKSVLTELKEKGISYDELISAVKEVFEEND